MNKTLLFSIFLLFLFSCQKNSKKIDLNLKGDVKKVIVDEERISFDKNVKWKRYTIELLNKKPLNIKYFGWTNGKYCSIPLREYIFVYNNKESIKEIYLKTAYNCIPEISKKINFKDFNFNFDYDFSYANKKTFRDSIIRNELKDIKEIWLTNKEGKKEKLNIKYKYDKFNNWILREVFKNDKLIEKSEREIIYIETLNINELKNKHSQLNDFFDLNNKNINELLLNVSNIYSDYSNLVWVNKNLPSIKKKSDLLEENYRKVVKSLKANINSIKNLHEKNRLLNKISTLNEIFEIEQLLFIQFNTISPILIDEYTNENWSEFDIEKVKSQTKSYLDRLNYLKKQYIE